MDKLKSVIILCRLNNPFISIPFAIAASFLASYSFPDIFKLICIFFAVLSAYMGGNIFNQIVDAEIDAINPRAQNRPLVNGTLSYNFAKILLVICGIVLIISTAMLKLIYVPMLILPVSICLVYSISKRFTWMCHILLALANASAPVGAWIVFSETLSLKMIVCGGVAFCWSLGFELIYSCQDVKYDLQTNMKSIPVVFGINTALLISNVSHVFMILGLLILGIILHVKYIYWIGCFAISVIILMEHVIISNGRINNAGLAFKINQLVSPILMLVSIIDKV